MEAIMGMMPVDLLIQELATKARLRTAGPLKVCWDCISGKGRKVGHRRRWDDLLQECRATAHPSDAMQHTRIWTPRQVVQEPKLLVDTDGSRMCERTG